MQPSHVRNADGSVNTTIKIVIIAEKKSDQTENVNVKTAESQSKRKMSTVLIADSNFLVITERYHKIKKSSRK